MWSELILSRHYRYAETRELGRDFYPILLEWANSADPSAELVVSFEGTEFVSPSFLDETIARLLEEEPAVADRLRLASVDAFTMRMLRSTLEARQITKSIPMYEPA